MFTPDRIAPCGLDCCLCEIAHLPEHPCPGCRSHGVDKPDFCADLCEIAHCESIAALSTPYCDSCNRYPCEPILALEQRYAAMYPLRESPMGNLKAIREQGVAAFLNCHRRKWSCPDCGGIISVHTGECVQCHRRFPTQD